MTFPDQIGLGGSAPNGGISAPAASPAAAAAAVRDKVFLCVAMKKIVCDMRHRTYMFSLSLQRLAHVYMLFT